LPLPLLLLAPAEEPIPCVALLLLLPAAPV